MHLKLFFFTLHKYTQFLQTYTITSLTLQVSKNGLKDFFSSTGFYLKSKVIEGSHKGKNTFFNFWALLLKMYIFETVIFFLPSGYPINSIFQW